MSEPTPVRAEPVEALPSPSTTGPDWAKLDELAQGDWLMADDGFTDCIPAGAVRQVEQVDGGPLFIRCAAGRHILDGQCEGDDRLIGLMRTDPPQPQASGDPA